MFSRLCVFVFIDEYGEYLFFFFDNKTAYEIRISDWSLDVCSSDLYVGQDAELFSGSVRENLLLGAREASEEKLLEALERSGASRFFGRDAAGFDLHIGERGSRLSGGQRSFLVMARGLVEPAKLL